MPDDGPEITPMRPEDWDRVADIFAEGIATGDSTFETTVPSWERWDRDHLPEPRLVARLGGRVVGWGAANRTSIRDVYRGVAEVSVYVAEEARGEGVGEPLLTALAEAAHETGLWTLEAIVIAENTASAKMVEACGFRLVGRRERLGELRGRWRDVLLYERRRAED
ncbi:MAG TPA: GNAT family N-acetyltransferase [Miltoncostaea sp.]|nr:GNAT family N-acetyltransferase [Miltoncostaea sp.]